MQRIPARSKSGFVDIGAPLPQGAALLGDETITIYKSTGPAELELSRLRKWMSGQFGLRLQSTGDAADVAQHYVITQVLGATPENPLIVSFDQLILAAFTGPGQFDLVERDADDVDIFDENEEYVSGGESMVTIATKTGFTDGDTTGGWSRLVKVITSDKLYCVIFVPGTTGDGIYSLNVKGLSRSQN
jgi:hypothetical protein